MVCNPETKCNIQEKGGVTQPTAGMFCERGGSKPPIKRKWLTPITESPLPGTMWKSSEILWENSPAISKATYAQSLNQGPPALPLLAHCPKQKFNSFAGDFWAGNGAIWDAIEADQTFLPLLHLLKQLTTERLCNKCINRNKYLVFFSQKRCLSLSHTAVIRSNFRSQTFLVQKQRPHNKNPLSLTVSPCGLLELHGPATYEV